MSYKKIIRNIANERGTSEDRGASRFSLLRFYTVLRFLEKPSKKGNLLGNNVQHNVSEIT